MKESFCSNIEEKIRTRPEALSQRDMKHVIRCRRCSAAFQRDIEAPILKTVTDKGRLHSGPGFEHRLKAAFISEQVRKTHRYLFQWAPALSRPLLAASVAIILFIAWFGVQPQIKEMKIRLLRRQVEARLPEEALTPEQWPVMFDRNPETDLDDLIAGLRRLDEESDPADLFSSELDAPWPFRKTGIHETGDTWKQGLFEEEDPFPGVPEFHNPDSVKDPYIFSRLSPSKRIWRYLS